MDFDIIAGFVSFAALIIVWAFAPKHQPATSTVPAAAKAMA